MALSAIEAKEHIGDRVVYCPGYGPFEEGVITEVRNLNVFVRYDGDQTAKATRPDALWLVSEYNPRDAWLDWKAGK